MCIRDSRKAKGSASVGRGSEWTDITCCAWHHITCSNTEKDHERVSTPGMDAAGRMDSGLCYGLDGMESDPGQYSLTTGKKRAQS